MSRPTAGSALLVAASAVILATVIAVIVLTPSPAEHRQVQRDNAVLSDLEQLDQVIERWHGEHATLPADLARLADQPGMSLALAPADGGPAYIYRPLADGRYQLCAQFLTDTADTRYGRVFPAERAHAAGQHCFARRVRLRAAD